MTEHRPEDVSIMYGVDSGKHDQLPAGAEITISVSPFTAHCLDRFVVSDDMADVIGEEITVAITGCERVFVAKKVTEDGHCCYQFEDKPVLRAFETVNARITIEKPCGRVCMTAIGDSDPASFALAQLLCEIEGEARPLRIQQFCSDYRDRRRTVEDLCAAQRGIPPLTDRMLGLPVEPSPPASDT